MDYRDFKPVAFGGQEPIQSQVLPVVVMETRQRKAFLLSCEEEQFMREKMEHVKHALEQKMWKVQAVLADRSGENFIDSAIFS